MFIFIREYEMSPCPYLQKQKQKQKKQKKKTILTSHEEVHNIIGFHVCVFV